MTSLGDQRSRSCAHELHAACLGYVDPPQGDTVLVGATPTPDRQPCRCQCHTVLLSRAEER